MASAPSGSCAAGPQEWGVDPHRVGVQGYSAGGNLCLNLAGRFDNGDPHAADHRTGQLPTGFRVLMCPWPNKRTIDDFPLNKNSPPTFIANARDDKTAPISFALAIDEKLKGLGVREDMFVVETRRPRRLSLRHGRGSRRQVAEALLPWLKKIEHVA